MFRFASAIRISFFDTGGFTQAFQSSTVSKHNFYSTAEILTRVMKKRLNEKFPLRYPERLTVIRQEIQDLNCSQ